MQLQPYERILLKLFAKGVLSELPNPIPISDAYLVLANIVLDENDNINNAKDQKIVDGIFISMD